MPFRYREGVNFLLRTVGLVVELGSWAGAGVRRSSSAAGATPGEADGAGPSTPGNDA